MIDLTEILEAAVKLIAAVTCAFIIPYIKTLCSASQLKSIEAWIKIAVAAAEQIYSSTQGGEKKQYVVNYLTDKGLKVDTKDLDKLIEASVLELHSELYGKDKTEA